MAGQAAAQSTSSVIRGTVFDQTGVPMAGVRVTATSPTQIGGPKTAYTDAEGNFRIVGLLPGVFDVSAAAPNLKTVLQKGIELSVNAPAEVTFLMEVETAAEEVVVVNKPKTVSTTAANVKETFSQEFAEKVPLTTRSYQNVADQAVGWNATGQNFRVRGGNTYDNNFMVDGFQLQDPVSRESAQHIPFDALAAVEVQSAAYGAENATAQGGVLNVVTKSGSNKLSAELSGTFTNRQMEFWRDGDDTTAPTRNWFLNGTVSGPIIKDRLWFATSLEVQNQVTTLSAVNSTGLPRSHPPRDLLAFRALGKATLQLTPRNKISWLTLYTPERTNNAAQSWERFPEAERLDRLKAFFTGVTLQSLLTDSLFWKTQVGFNQMTRETLPQACADGSSDCYNAPSIRTVDRNITLGSHDRAEISTGRQIQVNSDLEWFKDQLLGRHQFKLGFRVNFNSNPFRVRTPGDKVITYNEFNSVNPALTGFNRVVRYCDGVLPEDRDAACADPWLNSSTSGENGIVFLQDAWRITPYLTLSPGAAVSFGRQRDENGNTVISVVAPTPHVSAVWDATHDGRTVLRSSFASYVDTGFLRLARFGGRDLLSEDCRYDPATGAYTDCVRSGGVGRRTIGQPCGPTNVGADGEPCKNGTPTPRTWEYTLGAEREVFEGVALGGDVIYRKYTNQWQDAETNRIWNEGGTALDPAGGFKNGVPETIQDVSPRPENWRRYTGLTLFIRKYVGDFQALIAWTRHSQYGSPLGWDGEALNNASQTLYTYGHIETEQRNEAKFMGYYNFSSWLVLGTNIIYRNGNPYSRFYYNPTTNGFRDLRSPYGTNPRNPNDADDDQEARLPDTFLVYAQLRFKLKPLTGKNIETWIDAFNLAGNREATAYIQDDGATWGQLRSRRGSPPNFRVGLRYVY